MAKEEPRPSGSERRSLFARSRFSSRENTAVARGTCRTGETRQVHRNKSPVDSLNSSAGKGELRKLFRQHLHWITDYRVETVSSRSIFTLAKTLPNDLPRKYLKIQKIND